MVIDGCEIGCREVWNDDAQHRQSSERAGSNLNCLPPLCNIHTIPLSLSSSHFTPVSRFDSHHHMRLRSTARTHT
jgi:hypothetical protein